jgi:integrase
MRLKLYRGKWAAVGQTEGRVWRRSLGTADRAIAERRFRDLRFDTPGDTVEDTVKLYLAEKAEKRSHQSMLTAWRALKPTFGHLRPDQITRELCKAYATTRRRGGVADGTIIKDLGVLKAALNWAKKGADSVFEMPATPPARERYITREEHVRLLQAATLPHVKLFILLAWSTAARASALFELTWDRVDFQREKIQLSKGKGRGKGRATVGMTARAKAALLTAHEARTGDYVIEWGGKPVKSVKRAFAEAAKKAGLEDVTPHVLRHSAAVAMAESGASMSEIAQVLGHTNEKVTFHVYARYSPKHLKKAMRALE